MQDLRIVLVIIGALAIAALVIHGLWSSRKSRRASFKEKPLGKVVREPGLADEQAGFDQDGIGKVRIISRHGEAVVQDDPLDVALPPLSADEPTDAGARVEPAVMAASPAASVVNTWQDVYVINIMARTPGLIDGGRLANVLKLLGFCHGEMSIYHRHLEVNGQGDVLFSLINMVKPGTFEPETMSSFTTPGVSLFMQLPTKGRGLAHFELMLRAADKMASEVDGLLCDQDRQPLTDDILESYREQLRQYDSH